MFKSLFVIAFFAIAQLALATPPACLLGAVMTSDDPSDISTICKSKDMSGSIQKACGDGTQVAMQAYADVCKDAGVTVSSDVSSASASGTSKPSVSASASANKGSSASATATGLLTAVAGSASGSATGTGAPATSTGGAGRLEIGVVAAVVGGLVVAAL